MVKRGRSASVGGRRKRAKSAPRSKSVGSKRAVKNARIQGLLGIETKNLNFDFASASINNSDWASAALVPTGYATASLPLIAQGDDFDEREGRQVLLKRIMFKGQLIRADSAKAGDTGMPGTVRFLLVRDRQCNGAAFTGANVLDSGGSVVQDIHDFPTESKKKRFQILWDKTIDFKYPSGYYSGAAGFSYLAPQVLSFKMNVKLNFPVTYTSTTGVVGEITDNNIQLLALCTNNLTYLTGMGRLYFVG